ncbi:MAG: hypothetical protein ACTSUU_00665 [Candidatus Thorarchaeota archaeon]
MASPTGTVGRYWANVFFLALAIPTVLIGLEVMEARHLGALRDIDRRITVAVYAVPIITLPCAIVLLSLFSAGHVVFVLVETAVLLPSAVYGVELFIKSPMRYTRRQYTNAIAIQVTGFIAVAVGGGLMLTETLAPAEASYIMVGGAIFVLAGGIVRELAVEDEPWGNERSRAILVDRSLRVRLTTMSGALESKRDMPSVKMSQKLVDIYREHILQVFATGMPVLVPVTSIDPTGRGSRFRLDIKPLSVSRDRKVTSVVVVVTDVTATVEATEAEQVAELLERVASQRDIAEFYLDLLAHDMANRLQSIVMSLELLEYQHRLTPELSLSVRNAVDQVSMATDVIRNVRAISNARHSKEPLRPVKLEAAVKRALLIARAMYSYKNIDVRVVVPENVIVQADTMIDACLATLVSQCVKMQPGESASVRIEANQEDDHVKVAIGDFSAMMPEIGDAELAWRFVKQVLPQAGAELALATEIANQYGGTLTISTNARENGWPRIHFVLEIPTAEKALKSEEHLDESWAT